MSRTHHLLTTFEDQMDAERAYNSLKEAGFDEDSLSLVSRTVAEAEAPYEEQVESEELPAHVAKRVVKGGSIGAAAGGVTGFLAGAASFAIPGVGPVVGSGLLAATLGGAAAGATAGGVMAGITEMWHEGYEDSLKEGAVVLAVHTHDDDSAERAKSTLEQAGARRVDVVNVNESSATGSVGSQPMP